MGRSTCHPLGPVPVSVGQSFRALSCSVGVVPLPRPFPQQPGSPGDFSALLHVPPTGSLTATPTPAP